MYVLHTHTHTQTTASLTTSETLRIDDLFRFLILLKQFELLDECRILAFPPTLSFVRQRLVNHTTANISVIDRDTSEYFCNLDHNCASINFSFGENGAEAHNCELNNSTGKEYDKDLVKVANYVYHGT